ncbi:uncharacterized protein LOC103880626 isoform X11 [Papio anubis]|uniref:uncharacterized protein LOC103880626 isoform X11 n=1 Tax=Papio anubis TaxID=9555 RepID=UPI0012ADB060|nr:uncharacterized protein LOC103880626 isoform X11 [Papio anubis]
MIKNIPGADLDFADAFHGGGNHSHNCNFHCHKEMNQHLLIHPSRSQMQTLSNLDSLRTSGTLDSTALGPLSGLPVSTGCRNHWGVGLKCRL